MKSVIPQGNPNMDTVVEYLQREQAHLVIAVVLLHLARVGVGHLALMLTNKYRADPKTRKKIMSNAWYMTYYFAASGLGAYLLFSHTNFLETVDMCSWALSSARAFADYPLLYGYYVLQIAFYIEYILAIMAGVDLRRKDAAAFIIHHIVTIVLIVYSRYADQMPTQLAILVLHDSADPFLHVTKFVEAGFPGAPAVLDVCSVVFAGVFYVTRLFVFPSKVIMPCVSLVAGLLGIAPDRVMFAMFKPGFYEGLIHPDALSNPSTPAKVLVLAVSLLIVLYALHILWAWRIAQIAYATYVTKTAKVRDPDEDADADESATSPGTRLLRPRQGGKTAKTKKAE